MYKKYLIQLMLVYYLCSISILYLAFTGALDVGLRILNSKRPFWEDSMLSETFVSAQLQSC